MQGLTLVDIGAQLEQLQDTFVSQVESSGGQKSSSRAEKRKSVSPCQHAELQLRAGDHGEHHGAVEALVLLRIVVLEANLQLDGLGELAVLLLGLLKAVLDAIAQGVGG
jgi:hypothetical protein